MVAKRSTMLPLGTSCPDIELSDGRHRPFSLADVRDAPVLVVAFVCNHCPFVLHIRPELVRFAHGLLDQGGAFVAVNSNSVETHPQDGPEAMATLAEAEGFRFPYLFDRDQSLARSLRAACTPDFFVFDAKRELIYRGRFDASTPGNGVVVTGNELRAAVDAALANEPPVAEQVASIGCNIKWQPGAEPAYSFA